MSINVKTLNFMVRGRLFYLLFRAFTEQALFFSVKPLKPSPFVTLL